MLARLRQYRFDWKLSLLVLVLLPLLLRLGFWQLAREDEKLALQAVYEQRQAEPAVPVTSLDPQDDLQYRQVSLEGEYDQAHIFLLDNRLYQGQPGFEVLQPLVWGSGWALVNRGWVAQGPDRQLLEPLQSPPGQLYLTGSVYVPVGEQLVLGDIAPGPEWPKRIQRVDFNELAALAGLGSETAALPYSIRLAPGSSGVLRRAWSVISTSPEKHRGYAVQWFTMALVTLLLYAYYSTRPQGRNETHDEA